MVDARASGDFLVRRGLLTQDDLDSALAEKNRTDMSLGPILLDRKLVDEDDLIAALAEELGMEVADVRALRRKGPEVS
jgi:hypothetical protein